MQYLSAYKHLVPPGYAVQHGSVVKLYDSQAPKVLCTVPVLVLSAGNYRARLYIGDGELDRVEPVPIADLSDRATVTAMLSRLGLFDCVVRDGAGPLEFRRYLKAAIALHLTTDE